MSAAYADVDGVWPWATQAACLDVDVNLFFPAGKGVAPDPQALALCHSCPVQVECLTVALDAVTLRDRDAGIWAATTPASRHRLRHNRPEPPQGDHVQLTTQQETTILRHLIDGRSIDWTADAIGAPADQVSDVATASGWPSAEEMKTAVRALQTPPRRQVTLADDVRATVQEVAATINTARKTPRPSPAAAEPPAPEVDDAEGEDGELLSRLYADLDIADLAAFAQAALDAIDAWQSAHDEHAAQAPVRARIVELEEELERLRGQLGAPLGDGLLVCDECGRRFKNDNGLRVHVARSHKAAA